MSTLQELEITLDDVSQPEFGQVPVELVPTVWPLIEPILQTKGAKWLQVVSEAEVFEWLVSGRVELWMGAHNREIDGFVLGCWENHARSRRYCILYIAGQGLAKYMPQGLEKLEQYCALLGGSELVLEGRRGWAKWLRRYGYYADTVKLRKPTKVLWRN